MSFLCFSFYCFSRLFAEQHILQELNLVIFLSYILNIEWFSKYHGCVFRISVFLSSWVSFHVSSYSPIVVPLFLYNGYLVVALTLYSLTERRISNLVGGKITTTVFWGSECHFYAFLYCIRFGYQHPYVSSWQEEIISKSPVLKSLLFMSSDKCSFSFKLDFLLCSPNCSGKGFDSVKFPFARKNTQ